MPHLRQLGSGSKPPTSLWRVTSCSCTGIPQSVESQLGHYTPESIPLWLMSLYCQDSPVTPFLLGTGLLLEMEAKELCQEWPFSCYHLHWAVQGRQVRIPATSAGSSTPYTVLCGATALLVLLQSAALHTASQLRRCQAGRGMGYMPSTVGASDCLELPFPYCRNPSPTALRRGTSSALLFLLSQTTTGVSSVFGSCLCWPLAAAAQ